MQELNEISVGMIKAKIKGLVAEIDGLREMIGQPKLGNPPPIQQEKRAAAPATKPRPIAKQTLKNPADDERIKKQIEERRYRAYVESQQRSEAPPAQMPVMPSPQLRNRIKTAGLGPGAIPSNQTKTQQPANPYLKRRALPTQPVQVEPEIEEEDLYNYDDDNVPETEEEWDEMYGVPDEEEYV